MNDDELEASRRQLESILGFPAGSIGKPPPIPGLSSKSNREVRYIGCDQDEPNVGAWMDRLTAQFADLPTDGSLMEHGFRITLPLGEQLLAVSYRGDIPGWRRALESAAQQLNYPVARLQERVLVVDDGRNIPLELCKVERLETNRRGRILSATPYFES